MPYLFLIYRSCALHVLLSPARTTGHTRHTSHFYRIMSPQTIGPNPAYSQLIPSIPQISSEMPFHKRPSAGTLHSSSSLSDLEPQVHSDRSLSSNSILFSSEDTEPVLEEGISHIDKKLEARYVSTSS